MPPVQSRAPLPTERRCIGFEPFEGICTYSATVLPACLWCERCEKLRRAHLDKQIAAISKLFEKTPVSTTLPASTGRDVDEPKPMA